MKSVVWAWTLHPEEMRPAALNLLYSGYYLDQTIYRHSKAGNNHVHAFCLRVNAELILKCFFTFIDLSEVFLILHI